MENKLTDALTDKDASRIEFANRLHARMIAKGFSQSDLARHSAKHMPDGKKFGRDSLSHYMNCRTLPTPLRLNAMAMALGCHSSDLLPNKELPLRKMTSTPRLEVQDIGDGNARLRIDQSVAWPVALKILNLLNCVDKKERVD